MAGAHAARHFSREKCARPYQLKEARARPSRKYSPYGAAQSVAASLVAEYSARLIGLAAAVSSFPDNQQWRIARARSCSQRRVGPAAKAESAPRRASAEITSKWGGAGRARLSGGEASHISMSATVPNTVRRRWRRPSPLASPEAAAAYGASATFLPRAGWAG